jgi:hypothetical protein
VKGEILVVRLPIPDDDSDGLVAVGTLGFDDAVDMEGRPDPERIPGAVGEP